MSFSSDAAETLGLQALGWLVSNEELLPVFLGASGAGLDELKSRATDPVFLAGVLDFLMMDDAWVMAFCDSLGIPYDRLIKARAALPGGAQMNWT
ncbi:MAG: DUF3572 domain-containing protein [Pseudodonghicola sp.]|jgi:hypothetical protein|uniref:DUF3572 domain-containing protein n=1 Tax=Pseudodonghicola sp. TaxID=1969463 RepID=UPI003A96E46F